ncbi:hypothetical protein CAEBREN_28128 [Caenorhabditis brenneri]|uniref:RNA-directed DNA polymerase n=1 Tax=Caenorhabditis brenneri TaxID=135651 RepID=G0P426_CAEBE|nr:hypothetical protein CAEBREN_28128 [Caenorhabditis brenneri]
MPMGLCGAPYTFQKIAQYLQRMTKARIFCYLDDILLVSPSEEQHLVDIQELLQRIIDCGLKLKLEKCEFARIELPFLGYVVGRDGLKPNPIKVAAIRDYPIPTTPTGVRVFLGMIGYFRRFIRNFAEVAAGLHDLTKKDHDFIWQEEHQAAFEALKTALMSPPILVGPDLTRPYIMETDASSMAISAILLQKNKEDQVQAISYASRKLGPAERNYPPIEAEALAVVFGLQYYRQYVLGSHVTVVTDHKPLTSLMYNKNACGRLLKYQMSIQEFDAEIVYRAGRQNVVADALSRYTFDEVNEPKAVQVVQLEEEVAGISLQDVKDAQEDTNWIMEAKRSIMDQDTSRKGTNWRNRFAVLEGTVRQKAKNGEFPFVIPRDHPLKEQVIKRFHESKLHAAHLGAEKTLVLIKQFFFWTKMEVDVQQAIRGCLKCQQRKTNPHSTTKEEIGPVEQFEQPAQAWHLDHVGPLPITEQGHRYILVARDPFSRYLITAPTQTVGAEETTELFIKRVVSVQGTPKQVTTDAGTAFTSILFRQTLSRFGIEHRVSAPYHHESNGVVERINRTLEECLSAFVNETQTDWDQHLEFVTWAINAAPCGPIKTTPFQVMFGRKPTLPENNLLGPRTRIQSDYQATLEARLESLWSLIKKRNEEVQHRQKRCKERKLVVGDQILVQREKPKNKLAPKLKGPFVVKAVSGKNVTFEKNGKEMLAHKNDTRKWKSEEPLKEDSEESEGPLKEESEEESEGPLKEDSEDENEDSTKEDVGESSDKKILTPRRSERLRMKERKTTE